MCLYRFKGIDGMTIFIKSNFKNSISFVLQTKNIHNIPALHSISSDLFSDIFYRLDWIAY